MAEPGEKRNQILRFVIARHDTPDIIHEGNTPSFIRVATEHGYTTYDTSPNGYPLIRTLYGPMISGGTIHYQDAKTHQPTPRSE